MKKIICTAIMSLAIPSFCHAEVIKITVNGMVCAFCAQGIKKQFSAISGIEKVEPDLEHNLVVVTTKEGTDLSDERIKKVIEDAGYNTVTIERVH